MTWREKLPELEGLPLLPCGAGEKWKAPIDVNTGKPLQNWQNLSFTPEQIMGMNGVVKSVGVRTGPDADNKKGVGPSAIPSQKNARRI